jgi:hypothetical protein
MIIKFFENQDILQFNRRKWRNMQLNLKNWFPVNSLNRQALGEDRREGVVIGKSAWYTKHLFATLIFQRIQIDARLPDRYARIGYAA